jgi:hypothetical protein
MCTKLVLDFFFWYTNLLIVFLIWLLLMKNTKFFAKFVTTFPWLLSCGDLPNALILFYMLWRKIKEKMSNFDAKLEVKYNIHTCNVIVLLDLMQHVICLYSKLTIMAIMMTIYSNYSLKVTIRICTSLATHFSMNVNLYAHNRIWCVKALKIVL